MKILVVSDSHKRHKMILQAIGMESPFDMLVHCGDLEGDMDQILEGVTYPIQVVRGNMDWTVGSDNPNQLVFEVPGHKVFVTHGHLYDTYDLTDMKATAKDAGADIILFGHTHVPMIQREDGFLIVNPGSVARPRQRDGRPSYAVLTIDEVGRTDAEIRYLPMYSMYN